jgi:hypothetical protein
MAYNQGDVFGRTMAVTSGAIQTMLGIDAATNVVIQVTEATVSFDGATATNAPAVCEWDQITFATNAPGTNSTSVTPSKKDTGRGETFQATAGKIWTTQPTVITIQWPLDIAQFMGAYHYIHPTQSPFIVIGGKGGGLSVNSPNSVNSSGKISFIE